MCRYVYDISLPGIACQWCIRYFNQIKSWTPIHIPFVLLFYVLWKCFLKMSHIFLKIDYHASFQYTEVCGASIAVDSPSLYIPHFIITDGRKLKKWSVWVLSSSLIFLLKFVKMGNCSEVWLACACFHTHCNT